MAKEAKAFYQIKVKSKKPNARVKWIRIGSATEIEGEFAKTICCTIETLPLEILKDGFAGWDGGFYLFETDSKKKDEEPV